MEDTKAKVLIWDIETRGLQADYGSVLCIGWAWLGDKKVQVKSIHDIPGRHPLDDKALIEWFLKNVWSQADIAVGWYSSGHDEPFIRTRSVIHGLEIPKTVTTLDLWGKVWKRFKFSKNSLDNVSRHLKLGEKYYSPPDDFEKVLWGDKAAMKRIVKHCRIDVQLTRDAYEKLKAYVVTHPRTNFDLGTCKVCSSPQLQRRGYNFSAAKGRTMRVQCQGCGAWDTRTLKEVA